MTVPSVKLLARATVQQLVGGGLTVYPSRVEPALVLDKKGVVKGYAVFHPAGPDTSRWSLDAKPGAALWAFQVDCVGGSHDYVLEVVDEVIDRVDGHTLTVAGSKVGLLQPPSGYRPPPAFRDPQPTPYQLRLPLLYQVMAVPA